MNSCKILIADDEHLARQAIKLQLRENPELDILEASNGREALSSIEKNRPDIIFLDIRMPLLNGMEVLEQLPENYTPQIIIVSAYDNYAIEAFEKQALDYLVKPFTDERFSKAFERAYQLWNNGSSTLHKETLLANLQQILNLSAGKSAAKAMTIRDGSRIIVVKHEDILYIESNGDYVSVITRDRKYLHAETLTSLESLLPAELFFRIHKSTIVNISHVKELHSHFNGDYTIELHNGSKVKLSRNFRERFLSAFR